MFCANCGKSIDDNAVVCIHCGAPTQKFGGNVNVDPNEKPNPGFIVLSILVPIFGIVMGIVEKNNGKTRAGKSYLTASICSVAFWLIFTFVIVLISTLLPFIIIALVGTSEAATSSHSTAASIAPILSNSFSLI